MKKAFNSFILCFSMFSAIPTPQIKWESPSMKYIFCFLPLIGVIIGFAEIGLYIVAKYYSLSAILYSVIATLLPLILTGFIHVDGFIDTADALSSRSDWEKKQEILKDPHVGAFGIMYILSYVLLLFGIYCEFYINGGSLWVIAVAFVLSRVIGGLVPIMIKAAKGSGLLYLFKDSAGRKSVIFILSLYFIAVLLFITFFAGIKVAITLAILWVLFLLWFKRFVMKEFGGISGDLAGFAICISELLFIATSLFFKAV